MHNQRQAGLKPSPDIGVKNTVSASRGDTAQCGLRRLRFQDLVVGTRYFNAYALPEALPGGNPEAEACPTKLR
jgi:hypothetical protein